MFSLFVLLLPALLIGGGAAAVGAGIAGRGRWRSAQLPGARSALAVLALVAVACLVGWVFAVALT